MFLRAFENCRHGCFLKLHRTAIITPFSSGKSAGAIKYKSELSYIAGILKYKMIALTLKYKALSNQQINIMNSSLKKFVIIFLVSAFVFIGITNLILAPVNGDWFPGMDSPVSSKRTLANMIYPVKIVLVGPLAPIFNDPDPAPPIRVLACAIYWTVIAVVIYYVISIIKTLIKKNAS